MKKITIIGTGYGGSCFPKDISALAYIRKQCNIKMNTIEAAIKTNDEQRQRMVDKIKSLLNNKLKDKIIAVLGFSYDNVGRSTFK